MSAVLHRHTDLSPESAEWLHRLAGDWDMVADLSFSDLVLWVQGRDGQWVSVAHVRPTTGPNFFTEDMVGMIAQPDRAARMDESLGTGRLVRGSSAPEGAARTVREDYLPVRGVGKNAIAVISRHRNLATLRTLSKLELTYLSLADSLVQMIGEGAFPTADAPTGGRRGTPRVGDGVARVDVDGRIDFVSPNAVSAVHRLGHVGEVLGASLTELVSSQLRGGEALDETLPLVLSGKTAWRSEVEAHGVHLALRSIPLFEDGQRCGALILMRDVSELRRRERELLSKDATIREIHHRVKNNLQTVAALLRLQSRRMDDPGAKAALREAGRRVGTIALVHDTLSQGYEETVVFDDIARRLLQAAVEVAVAGIEVRSVFTGEFGSLRGEDATPLAMAMAELINNAVEHGLADTGGTVHLDARRFTDGEDEVLEVTVTDDGAGMPDGPPAGGLGTKIVASLIQDLRGTISWEPATPRGTTVRFLARLRDLEGP